MKEDIVNHIMIDSNAPVGLVVTEAEVQTLLEEIDEQDCLRDSDEWDTPSAFCLFDKVLVSRPYGRSFLGRDIVPICFPEWYEDGVTRLRVCDTGEEDYFLYPEADQALIDELRSKSYPEMEEEYGVREDNWVQALWDAGKWPDRWVGVQHFSHLLDRVDLLLGFDVVGDVAKP